MSDSQILLQLDKVQKSFTNPEGKALLVLEDISFTLKEGEIIALLGKSGSGKSTLLRIIAGLTKPNFGKAFYHHQPIQKPVQGISMVFQNFALLPWLTVLENVELGLEAQGINKKERRLKSLQTIDTIGLDGFENAYPKELSGGMRQRVGFARALVVEPELLLMDEPFSALDILTADNLRNDLLDLWIAKRTRTKGIITVTHDIEEAILMANRILIIQSDPGRIQAEVPINMPFPRNPESPIFREFIDHIYGLLTMSERERISKVKEERNLVSPEAALAYRLPDVSVSEITGLLEAMVTHEKDNKIDLPELAEDHHLDLDSLFPLTEILDKLQFATISKSDVLLLNAGKQFAAADILERKRLFAKHLLRYIPLAHHIRTVLKKKSNHSAKEERFVDELQEFLTEEEAKRILKIMIDWGRYAELFSYDFDTGMLYLDQ